MTVYRCFVEKKPEFAVEARSVWNDLKTALRTDRIKGVRILNRYDLENIEYEDYLQSRYTILSEPQVDDLYEEEIIVYYRHVGGHKGKGKESKTSRISLAIFPIIYVHQILKG